MLKIVLLNIHLVWLKTSWHICLQYLLYLLIDIINKGKQEGIEVSQEQGKDAAQLPLQGNPRMIILQFSDGLKQRWTHQTQQRHYNLHL